MKRTLWPLFLIVLAAGAAILDARQAQSLSETRSGRRAEAYFSAFNEGEAAMKEYFIVNASPDSLRQVPVETRLVRYLQMRERLGTLEIGRVVAVRADSVSVEARGSKGLAVSMDFLFEKEDPFFLLGIRVMDIGGGGEGGPPPANPKKDDAALIATVKAEAEKAAALDEFSGVVLIARNGAPIFQAAYGLADREKKIPNRTDTRFNIGSINKSSTGLAARQLIAQGKIAPGDTIEKYLPDYPNRDAATTVTVGQLLSMTSGIGDFFNERYEKADKLKIRTLRDYLPLFADEPLAFEPGSRNMYSNGGYVVLGLIIEKASGTDYYDYVRENIFEPAGMADTESFPKDAAVENRALGYTGAAKARKNNYDTLPGRGSSAGGGYSTAADLLKYVMALDSGALGASPDMRGGFAIAGGAPGLNAAVEWDPQKRVAVIVLANIDPPAAAGFASLIVSWLPR
jgi:D-alanyl-D-alanine carboxypeptidase